VPTYNERYNPYEPAKSDLLIDYSPYDYGEPLYDDRELIVARLPTRHTLAALPKKPRKSWV